MFKVGLGLGRHLVCLFCVLRKLRERRGSGVGCSFPTRNQRRKEILLRSLRD